MRMLALLFALASVPALATTARPQAKVTVLDRNPRETAGRWPLQVALVVPASDNGASQTLPLLFTFKPAQAGLTTVNIDVDVQFPAVPGKTSAATERIFKLSRAQGFTTGNYTLTVTRTSGKPMGQPVSIDLQRAR